MSKIDALLVKVRHGSSGCWVYMFAHLSIRVMGFVDIMTNEILLYLVSATIITCTIENLPYAKGSANDGHRDGWVLLMFYLAIMAIMMPEFCCCLT